MGRNAPLLIALVLLTSPALAADGWEPAKDEDGVKVYLRKVPGSDMLEYRGVTEGKGRLSAFAAMLRDPAGYPAWLHNAVGGETVKTEGEGIVYPHVFFDLPWPVDDRDMVFKGALSQDPETLAVTVAMTGEAALIPPSEDYVRMPKVKGGYVFRPKPGGAVEIDYQLHVEPGGALPAWLVNALAVDTPFETLRKMREVVRTPKYRDAQVPGVREPDP